MIRARNESSDDYQLKTPITIKEFIDDMEKLDIQLYWTDWIVKKFRII